MSLIWVYFGSHGEIHHKKFPCLCTASVMIRRPCAEDRVPLRICRIRPGIADWIHPKHGGRRGGETQILVSEDPEQNRVYFRIGNIEHEIRGEKYTGVAF